MNVAINRVGLLLLACVLIVSLGSVPTTSFACSQPVSYGTTISEQDRYNSKGRRLRSASAIIRQDRANFHRFGRRDPGDGSDSFFHRANGRAELERAVQRSSIDRALQRQIVSGGVLDINVTLCNRGRGSYVEVVEGVGQQLPLPPSPGGGDDPLLPPPPGGVN